MDKQTAKKLLLMLVLLYVIGAAVLFALLLALSSREGARLPFAPLPCLGIALLCALVPTGACNGIVLYGLKITELTKTQMLLIVLFLPLLIVSVTVAGIVMLVPQLLKIIHILRG